MLHTTRLLLPTLFAARSVLRRGYGWRWPFALARCVRASRGLLRTTRWGVRSDAEARFVSVLTLFPAILLDARRHFGKDADGLARDLLKIVLDFQARRIAADLAATVGAHERWHAFADRAVLQGIGAFNETECLSVDGDRFHLRVHRCLFADLALDTGVLELAQILCDLGAAACGRLLSSYEFHRNGPAHETLAFRHTHCDYVWESREPVALAADLPGKPIGHTGPAEPAAAGATGAKQRSETNRPAEPRGVVTAPGTHAEDYSP
jgi:hypothetical protein